MTDALAKLEEITAMIAEAHDAVADGDVVDLAELQGHVQDVCMAIQASPPANADQVHGKIVALIESLNSLATALKDQQKRLGEGVIRDAVRKAYKGPGDDN